MQSKIDFLDLPVYRHRDLILSSLETDQVIIVESPTGSGKTTQIPLILKEAGYDRSGIIGVTQPRRIATLSICDFIRRQLDIQDNYCAYTMRFADTSDETTRIKVMTDGILLQELKGDRYLSRYSVMMVDEAHERSLNIDFILGLLKQVLEVRKDLKVIISSATINTRKFSEFFGKARIISIPTKVYPVDVQLLPSYGQFTLGGGEDDEVLVKAGHILHSAQAQLFPVLHVQAVALCQGLLRFFIGHGKSPPQHIYALVRKNMPGELCGSPGPYFHFSLFL